MRRGQPVSFSVLPTGSKASAGRNGGRGALHRLRPLARVQPRRDDDFLVAQRIDGDVVEEIRQLKASDGPELHVWGSGELLQTLIAAELVDEYRIWLFPVLLGGGKRLFENGVPPRGLILLETRSTPKGVLVNTYRPSGPLPRE